MLDNLVTGTDTEDTSIVFPKRNRQIFQEASEICKWTSNHPNIMSPVDEQQIPVTRETHVFGLQWTTKEESDLSGIILATVGSHSAKRKVFGQFTTRF